MCGFTDGVILTYTSPITVFILVYDKYLKNIFTIYNKIFTLFLSISTKNRDKTFNSLIFLNKINTINGGEYFCMYKECNCNTPLTFINEKTPVLYCIFEKK